MNRLGLALSLSITPYMIENAERYDSTANHERPRAVQRSRAHQLASSQEPERLQVMFS